MCCQATLTTFGLVALDAALGPKVFGSSCQISASNSPKYSGKEVSPPKKRPNLDEKANYRAFSFYRDKNKCTSIIIIKCYMWQKKMRVDGGHFKKHFFSVVGLPCSRERCGCSCEVSDGPRETLRDSTYPYRQQCGCIEVRPNLYKILMLSLDYAR